ncbi:response regulator [Rhizobium sp. BK379]|uniref:response regulator n=1 Tax=Rhizobium sp. BK379 TaxID=2587059 RepID=UPI0016216D19|nr:response regulator [Rhizobium sp. BK379]MBB3445100.1 CheY-like chemotaxis protein [Rhizobium sp. BK379]
MATNVKRSWQREHLMEQRVLIVEDELLIALDLETTIEDMGVHVAGLASDREGALRLAPLADIAFVDVNLSDGATGPEIGRQLAQDHGISVVFMTANPEAVVDGVHGALGVVQKPVMPTVVEQLLRYVAARRAGMLAVVPQQMMVFAS